MMVAIEEVVANTHDMLLDNRGGERTMPWEEQTVKKLFMTVKTIVNVIFFVLRSSFRQSLKESSS